MPLITSGVSPLPETLGVVFLLKWLEKSFFIYSSQCLYFMNDQIIITSAWIVMKFLAKLSMERAEG
jgi:hypothetical protein